jgi:hypothetical protein
VTQDRQYLVERKWMQDERNSSIIELGIAGRISDQGTETRRILTVKNQTMDIPSSLPGNRRRITTERYEPQFDLHPPRALLESCGGAT